MDDQQWKIFTGKHFTLACNEINVFYEIIIFCKLHYDFVSKTLLIRAIPSVQNIKHF
jgi:hypothetical protein